MENCNNEIWIALITGGFTISAVLIMVFYNRAQSKKDEEKWIARRYLDREYDLKEEFYTIHHECLNEIDIFIHVPDNSKYDMIEKYEKIIYPLMKSYVKLSMRIRRFFNDDEQKLIRSYTKYINKLMDRVLTTIQNSPDGKEVESIKKIISNDELMEFTKGGHVIEGIVLKKLDPKLLKKIRKKHFGN